MIPDNAEIPDLDYVETKTCPKCNGRIEIVWVKPKWIGFCIVHTFRCEACKAEYIVQYKAKWMYYNGNYK